MEKKVRTFLFGPSTQEETERRINRFLAGAGKNIVIEDILQSAASVCFDPAHPAILDIGVAITVVYRNK